MKERKNEGRKERNKGRKKEKTTDQISKTHESGWPGPMKVGGPATHFHACADTRVPKCADFHNFHQNPRLDCSPQML